jgi:hypothetical protein
VSRSRLAVLVALSSLAAIARPATSALPEAVSQYLYAFPGGRTMPGSASSAALALADRFLGEEPFANPAVARPRILALSPALVRVSRQDLRADNRNYDEQPAFIDAAGGWFGWASGRFGLALYGYQPELRLEDNAFSRGTDLASPGTVQSNMAAREFRAGLALSVAFGRVRVGVAPEWTSRSDHYERRETGGPIPQTWMADFSGDAVGGQAGFRASFGRDSAGTFALGGGLRRLTELTLEGDERDVLVTGRRTIPISVARAAGWEGGLSLRWSATESFRVLAAAADRTRQEYVGFDVTRGAGTEWKVAAEYHDRRDPWTVRFGFGSELETGVPEPRAGVVGLGFGWIMESTVLDVGVVHRSFERTGHPASAEDRVVVSLVQTF